MTQNFFVSLPVKDVEKSRAFYAALGGAINPQFSGNGSACMVFAENFFVMLSSHEKWASFTTKPILKGSMALGVRPIDGTSCIQARGRGDIRGGY